MEQEQIFDDFKRSLKTCFSKYFDHTGRASRTEYWYFMIFATVVSSVVESITRIGLISIILIIPSIMVTIRRFHDVGKSGTWLLWMIFPMVGFFIIIYHMVQRGDNDDNQYGTRPTDGEYAYEPSSDGFNEYTPPYETTSQDASFEVEETPKPAEPARDRYGRLVEDKTNGRKPKNDDFLEG